jgi:hypothetical protein
VTMEEALKASTHPHDFRLLVAAEGRRSTSMVDVAPRADAEGDEPPGASSNGHGDGHAAPASPPAPVTPLAPSRPDPDPDAPTNPPPAPPDPAPAAASDDARGSAGSVPPPGAA